MSAGLVLALCLVLGAVLAMVASPIVWAFAAILTRGRGSRQRLLLSAVALPWASLAWFLLVLVASSIADQAMGTDMGIGDDFFVSLPNGYRLSMIHALNHASLENPKHSSPVVNNVQRLQIHETLILGAVHEKRRDDPETLLYSPEPIDGYFILDVGTASASKFQSREDLGRAAAKRGISLKLDKVEDIYWRYRPKLVQTVARWAWRAGPFLGFCGLCFWIIRIRRLPEPTLKPPATQTAPEPSASSPQTAPS